MKVFGYVKIVFRTNSDHMGECFVNRTLFNSKFKFQMKFSFSNFYDRWWSSICWSENGCPTKQTRWPGQMDEQVPAMDLQGQGSVSNCWTSTYNETNFRTSLRTKTDQSFLLKKTELNFTLMSYNILSQDNMLNHPDLYAFCPPIALKWPNRGTRILKEIELNNPDILCGWLFDKT